MTRAITGAVDAAVSSAHLFHHLLIKMDFTGGVIRFTDCSHDIVWSGNTFIGIGNLGAVEAPKEVATEEIVPMRFSISGIPQNNRAIALDPAQYKNRAVTLYSAFFDATTKQLVPDPVIEWSGFMDTFSISLDESGYSIVITAENEFAALTRPIGGIYSDENQRAQYPGDTGFQLLNNNAGKTIIWPTKELQYKYARR